MLRAYTMSWRCLACCQENAVRVGLPKGVKKTGVVDAQQAEHAARSLAQAKAFNARKLEQRKAQRESFKKKAGEQAKKRPFNKVKKPEAL